MRYFERGLARFTLFYDSHTISSFQTSLANTKFEVGAEKHQQQQRTEFIIIKSNKRKQTSKIKTRKTKWIKMKKRKHWNKIYTRNQRRYRNNKKKMFFIYVYDKDNQNINKLKENIFFLLFFFLCSFVV